MTSAERQDFVSGLLDDYGCAIETGDRSGASRYRTLILKAVEDDDSEVERLKGLIEICKEAADAMFHVHETDREVWRKSRDEACAERDALKDKFKRLTWKLTDAQAAVEGRQRDIHVYARERDEARAERDSLKSEVERLKKAVSDQAAAYMRIEKARGTVER